MGKLFTGCSPSRDKSGFLKAEGEGLAGIIKGWVDKRTTKKYGKNSIQNQSYR